MGEREQLDLRETIDRLREEVRKLRDAVGETEAGKAMLQQGEEFSRILSLSKLIVSELDLEKVFNLVAENAREIVSAELVMVPMLNEAQDKYTYLAAAGADADRVRGTTLGSHVGTCGWVLRNKRSLLFGETSTHWMDEKTTWEAGQQSSVLVPLFGRKGIIGGLSALGKQGGGCFTQHDLDLLTLFANQVSTAIENAQFFSQMTQEMAERERAEEALKESEQRYKLLLGSITDYIYTVQVWDNHPVSTVHGMGCASVTGYSPEDYATDPHLWYRMVYGPDQPAVLAQAARVLSGERVPPLEHRIIHRDGSLRWVRNTSVPRFDQQRNLIAYDGLIEDISERKLAEEALQKNEKRMRDMFSSLGEGVYVVNREGLVTFLNPEAERLLGWREADLLGKVIHTIVHYQKPDGTLLPPDECPIHAVFGTGTAFTSMNEIFIRKDGTAFPVSIIAAPLTEDGMMVGSVTAFRDITDSKHAEQEREQLIAELQKALAEIKTLHGILPICSVCKKIRDDKGSWTQMEAYISTHTDADFSHGYCPECGKKAMEDFTRSIGKKTS